MYITSPSGIGLGDADGLKLGLGDGLLLGDALGDLLTDSDGLALGDIDTDAAILFSFSPWYLTANYTAVRLRS